MNLVTSRDRSRDIALRVAMWSVIASEAVVFASLLAMRGGPRLLPEGPALATAAAIAASLFMGGGALTTAMRRIRDGQRVATGRLLVAACGLGFVALGLEIASARLYGTRDPVGLIVIGLHVAHVSAAIALAFWVASLVRCGKVHRRHHEMLPLVRSFWYFVGAVWIFVWPLFTAPRA
jgi:heme/copper-type cytochrome/quinol oxidase subunit 3